MTDSRHSDNFQRGEPATKAAAKDKPTAQPKPVDNESQAALAEAQRSFTVGGDAPETGGTAPPDAHPTPMIDAALSRFARPDRPSPFGVAHFPPLPMPPAAK